MSVKCWIFDTPSLFTQIKLFQFERFLGNCLTYGEREGGGVAEGGDKGRGIREGGIREGEEGVLVGI